MKKKLLIFDLDGTLIDSKLAITSTIQKTLSAFGIKEDDENKLTSFIGPTRKDIYQGYYGLNDSQLTHALNLHKSIFEEIGIAQNKPYKGIVDFLENKKKDNHLAIATTKYTDVAVSIIKHTKLEYFEHIVGADDSMVTSDKTPLLQQVISRYPDISNDKIIMIGDRKFDILAAQNTGITSIAVMWGFGSAAELQSSKPTHIAKSVEDLEKLV